MKDRGDGQLEVIDWGRLDYGEAHARQLELVAARQEGRAPDRLVLVEHPPVVTLGRGGSDDDLNAPVEALRRAGLEVHRVERGGQATYHGPGQMVAYPIVKLGRKDLHWFVDGLLEAAAAVLRSYGLVPDRQENRPGLWVGGGKIASVGLAVRSWVTFHGLALNVNTDLSWFEYIVPCGRPAERLESMAGALNREIDPGEVKDRFVEEFRRTFGYVVKGNHPEWLIRPAPDRSAIERMEEWLGKRGLATVCQSAHCPNLGECFERGTATFMILGRRCTRGCRFCAVEKGRPCPPDLDEPERVAEAARALGLRHVVATSVTRDDLDDGGAGQFARTIEAVRRSLPEAGMEVLIPDFRGSVKSLDTVCAARPDVFNHNVETVARLYPSVRAGADYERSLAVLRHAASRGLTVKSGLMLGLGETKDEISRTLVDLKRTGCRLLTLGQYLAPSRTHTPVVRYIPPDEFEEWKEICLNLGFAGVAAGPLVRSSYRAEAMYSATVLPKRRAGINPAPTENAEIPPKP